MFALPVTGNGLSKFCGSLIVNRTSHRRVKHHAAGAVVAILRVVEKLSPGDQEMEDANVEALQDSVG